VRTEATADSGNASRDDRISLRRRFGLGNWRVTVRLVALIAIPTMVAVLLAGFRVSTSIDSSTVFAHAERLATFGNGVAELTQALSAERDLSAQYVATPRDLRRGDDLHRVQAQTDLAAAKVRSLARDIDGSISPIVRPEVSSILDRLDSLASLRQVATQTRLSPIEGTEVYSESISDLLQIHDLIAQGVPDSGLGESTRTLTSLAHAKEAASKERAILVAVLIRGEFEPAELETLQAARAERDSALNSFQSSATVAQRQDYEDTVTGPELDKAEAIRQEAIVAAQASPTLSVAPLRARAGQEWFNDMGARLDRMRAVETRLSGEIVAYSHDRQAQAKQRALLNGGLLLIVLLLVLAVTIIVARSLVGPLRRLRIGALDVAGNRLPDAVRRLREVDGNESLSVEPIDVDTTDEIGEVARAFDEVHREAVRLASNEALLRGNFNAMFVNLSRRSQSLIERQLRLIEDLEQSEQDSGRLDSLFKLDHLATRMRRNCENLLVLGGQDQARRWNKPVPLVDIVRASLSEVEQYNRITLRIQDDVSVEGRSVNDLVHLVAELVENSTSFSPEHTKVAVSGHLLSGGGAMLQISDSGVGMTPEQLEEANWRLANPPAIDVSVSRRMGLFVVGRLAQRHGIRVELRAALSGGLTAFVILPARAIMQDSNMPVMPQRLDRPADTPVTGSAVAGSPTAGSSALPPVAGPPADRRQLPHWTEPDRPAQAPGTPREPARGPSTPLPKRKSAPTAPPGRGTAPTAPARSAPPRPQSPPSPARPSSRPSLAGPPVGESRSANYNSGRSPIFEAMQSEWFQRRKTGSMAPSESPPLPPEWSSPGDEGWRAAENVRAPAVGGQTNAGLPKRVPGSNRIPGTAGAAGAATQARQAAPPPVAGPPQAEAVRNRFASFQQGVRRGRAAIQPEDDERENQ
jgi:signal transduction histidine kinase